MNRQERRRLARARAAATEPGRPPGEPRPLIVGDGIVARSIGEAFEARPAGQLPAKVPGQHRWIVAASWTVTPAFVAKGLDAEDGPSFLDNENLLGMSVGCWDCEKEVREVGVDSDCPAPGDD